MKNIFLLTIILIAAGITAEAQIILKPSEGRNKFKHYSLDTLINNRFAWQSLVDTSTYPGTQIPPFDHMPLAGSMPRKFSYLGNNQKGFDVYQTYQDNMYILKPDSTFVSNMPVAGQKRTFNMFISPLLEKND